MILTTDELLTLSTQLNLTVNQLTLMANGIEDFIRQYTNNNFTVKNTTFITPVVDGKLEMVSPLFKEDDTILIYNSMYNDGVYVLKELNGTLDITLIDEDEVKTSLVRYPQAIKLGVTKLLQYNARMDDKVGIASESISRHSVSYQAQGSDSIGGYPSNLMSFLKPYMKARF